MRNFFLNLDAYLLLTTYLTMEGFLLLWIINVGHFPSSRLEKDFSPFVPYECVTPQILCWDFHSM